MSEVFQRLINNNNLPRYLRKSADPARAITISYDGVAGVVTIDNHTLTTSVRGGSGGSFSIDLTGFEQMSELVAFINTQPGYTATVFGIATITYALIGDVPDVSLLIDWDTLTALVSEYPYSPASLIEVENQSIVGSDYVFSVFTSLLWQLLYPIAWAIEDSTVNEHGGLDETAVESADDSWLDKWGNLYGFILRLAGESDPDYALRIIEEVGRWRLNKNSIQNALTDAGIDVTQVLVSDGHHDAVWVMGDPLGKILIDRIHCWDVIWVQWTL